MTHFSLEQWSDFARKRTAASAETLMQRHLDEGCVACAQILAMWKSVLEVAGRETGFQVPEQGAARAKALFRIARPARADSLTLRLTRLVFSSSAEPLREGVRSAAAPTTHLLFQEGNYLLDLHMKPVPERNVISVAGQILDRSQSKRMHENSIITVMRRTEELVRTSTNQFGEFQLEHSPLDNLMLTVELEGKVVLVSLLPDLSAGPPPRPPEK